MASAVPAAGRGASTASAPADSASVDETFDALVERNGIVQRQTEFREHPEVAADQFLALFLGIGTIKSMLGLGKPSAAADARLVGHNVAMFMRAYAAG